ncbi:hypothetical protein BH10PSE1_BH10PSE1_27150 [soil metagenome]
MTLTDGLLWVCILMAAGMVVGFVALAMGTDRIADRSPAERSAVLKDKALTLAPAALFMAWLGATFFAHDYLTTPIRIAFLAFFVVATFAWSSLPVVKRARERLKSLRRYPSQ